jgi:hypothetical protein
MVLSSGLFAAVIWFVFQLSFWNIFFLILMFIFYVCAGYYAGLLNAKKMEAAFLSKEDVDKMSGGPKKL